MCNFYEPSWRAEYLRDDTYKHLVALVCTDIIATLPTILLNALLPWQQGKDCETTPLYSLLL